jgi:LPS-assembly protein
VVSDIQSKEPRIFYVDTGKKEIHTVYVATGNVVITYQDMEIRCDGAQFDTDTGEGKTTGLTLFTQKQQWLRCAGAEFNLNQQTGIFYNATGFTDKAFQIQGQTVRKTGPDTYEVEKGFLTACPEERPKWGFSVGRANIRIDQIARLRNVFFKIKGVPVLYLPYMIVPMEKRSRNSGFLPFRTGSSNSKGRQFSIGYFQTLGQSADITYYGDYFSKRGMGFGGILRARPNEQTNLNILAYSVRDRLDQGGAHVVVDGYTTFKNGFRTVASVNITTNFEFRQAFSDEFRSATIPLEQSILFATKNSDSFSANFAFERQEVRFPGRSLVVRKSPSLELLSLGMPLGKLPLILSLRAAAEGISRADSLTETPRIVQRLDFYPQLTLRLPSFAGFSLIPTAGMRETYYSARFSDETEPVVTAAPLHRLYSEVEIDLRTPRLERSFHSSRFGDFTHFVEPIATYRRIDGIDRPSEVIRFDEHDAIADTNEAEYGLVNRIIRRRTTESGRIENYEFLSLKVAQKNYFDPGFGGSFVAGESNIFYPLNTLSGFAATGIQRSLSPTNVRLRLTPKPGVSYEVDADYDTKLHRLRDTSITALVQQGKVFLAGTYFKTNALEPGMYENHHIQGQFEYGSPERDLGLSFGASVSYSLQNRSLLNSSSRVNYAWNCCSVALEFQQFDLGVRTESRFSFSFSLKGIGSFGNLKRAESFF